jgi:predicted aspartyl protease
MSLFKARLKVANMDTPRREGEFELLVDTGAAYSWVSRQRLQDLGIEPAGRLKFQATDGHITDGHIIERETAPVRVAIDGRTGGDTIVFAEPGDVEVFGAPTLEALAMAADPVNKKLVPLTVALAL